MSAQAVALLIGISIGAAAASAAAWGFARRRLARIEDAERRARAAERMAEIGAMTGGLAHEIKNPLSTIGLNAQLLAEAIEELPIDADERGRLSRRMASLRREVERLRGILTDFLQYAGNIHLAPKPADINTAIGELVDFFLPQAEKHGVRLRADLADGPLTANVDVPLVKQAILNLMLNAVQAMAQPAPSGAALKELILKTERAAAPDRSPLICIHVIDTGPGVPQDRLARIFEPYFSTKTGGTGLGLPTTRRLVEAHGGRIDVHTEPGRGTDFRIVLPAAADHPPA